MRFKFPTILYIFLAFLESYMVTNSVIMLLKLVYSVQLNFCKVWYSLGWVRLWCLTPLPTPWFLPVNPPPFKIFSKYLIFVYTSWIYQNYCSVMYIYRDIHDFMFPFFKLWFYYKIFLVIMHHSFGNLNTSV